MRSEMREMMTKKIMSKGKGARFSAKNEPETKHSRKDIAAAMSEKRKAMCK